MTRPFFLSVRSHLAGLLGFRGTEIFCFGPAPDNTADGQDALLENGVFYRIIAYGKNLGIDGQSTAQEILEGYRFLVENFEPRWASVFIEEGLEKREVTIELMYQEAF